MQSILNTTNDEVIKRIAAWQICSPRNDVYILYMLMPRPISNYY